MGKVDEYCQVLRTLDSWDDYLKAESHLPGPRANLELAYAVGLEGTPVMLLRYAGIDPQSAPENTPENFLAVCGVMGLGYLMARGQGDYFEILRQKANDPRWRVREAVALGLQQYGRAELESLLPEMKRWSEGSLLERRAAVAVLCEPDILADQSHAAEILRILDQITTSVPQKGGRRSGEFKALRKALGYGWSVAVAAQPQLGKPYFEKWVREPDKDVRWIMKNNLKKKRLVRMDEGWVGEQLKALDIPV